ELEERKKGKGAAEMLPFAEPNSGLKLPAPARTSLADLVIDDVLRAWAAKHEIAVDLALELERFRNYCSSRGTRYLNHAAAFRNWLRKAKEYQAERGVKASGVRDKGVWL